MGLPSVVCCVFPIRPLFVPTFCCSIGGVCIQRVSGCVAHDDDDTDVAPRSVLSPD